MKRPRKIGMGTLFCCLMEREELEYRLPSDEGDPNIAGDAYRAPLGSRWDTPEFAAIFAATLRSMALLQSSRGFFKKPNVRAAFFNGIKLISQLKASHVEAFHAEIAAHASGNLTALMAQARDKGHVKVFHALKHMQMITSNVPLTDGHKMALRQSGHAMNLHRGPMSGFFATSFAETWSPILALLADGPGEPLGTRARGLRQDAPLMPVHREMHRISAQRPMLQAWHYLLHDAAMHSEILCVRNAHLGKYRYDFCHDLAKLPVPEDDVASTGEPGIYNFVSELLKAMEAQGRGYARGHGKTRRSSSRWVWISCAPCWIRRFLARKRMASSTSGAAEHALKA